MKRPKKKSTKPKPRLVNEISGYIYEYTDEHPDNWTYCYDSPVFIRGRRRQYATIRWADGSESRNVPMPIIAKPGDVITFTLRPA